MNSLLGLRSRLPLALLAALAALGCGHKSSGAAGGQAAASSSAGAATSAPGSANRPAGSAVAPAGSAGAAASAAPAGNAPPVAEFIGARGLKACKERTQELAVYQQRGGFSLGGQKGGIAAAWMVHIAHKTEDQVAFASFDGEGKSVARTRGVGFSSSDARVFGTGSMWAVTWFDAKGLAYAQPHNEPLPAPDVAHLGSISADVKDDAEVASLAGVPSGALVAVAPFGAEKAQLGLFQFAPEDAGEPPIKAIGVTHHAKEPRRPALAANAAGSFIAWQEPDGHLAASHFDPAGKETDAACVIAPPSATKREQLSLALMGEGAVAMWMEGTSILTRTLDKAGCPSSPVWTIADGRWAQLTSSGEGAVVAWVAADGRYLAAKLAPNGAPPPRGLDVAEGSTGVKDPPALAAMDGRVAFGWAEVMSSTVSTKRLIVRIVNSDCLP